MIKYVCDWCNEDGLPNQGVTITRTFGARDGQQFVSEIHKDLCDRCQIEFFRSLDDTQARIWAANG
jgi:hypothetical protein